MNQENSKFENYLYQLQEETLNDMCTSEDKLSIYEASIKRVLLNKIIFKWEELKEIPKC